MPSILFIDNKGQTAAFQETLLSKINKKEEFLEEQISKNIELLGIESLSDGIYGPFLSFRQLTFHSPQGRLIKPDIVLLSASGHIIIVEVKLYNNPELKDRQVIAQIIDYAASFSALSEEEINSIFNTNPSSTWYEFIALSFPEIKDVEELSDLLITRIQEGQLHLIIACDKAPIGLKEILEGITKQKALPYHLSVLEITPYMDSSHNLLLINNTKYQTIELSKTTVVVKYETGTPEPQVTINVDSPEQIEQNIKKAYRRKKTLVHEAQPKVKELLAHLIKEKRIRTPWIWRGFDYVFELHLENYGRFKIDVCFWDIIEEDYFEGKYNVRVSFAFYTNIKNESYFNELYEAITHNPIYKNYPFQVSHKILKKENQIEWFFDYRDMELGIETIASITKEYVELLLKVIPFVSKIKRQE